MDRIWLKSYPPGVPADIDPNEYKSLVDLFEAGIRKYAARPAFTNMGKTISYGELDGLSRAFGAWLQAKGLGKGARVALMMPNCLQYPVAMFGTLRAGCTVVNVNPLYTPRELEHQLGDSGARAIVILENFCTTLQQVLGKTPVEHVVTTQIGDLAPFPNGALMNFVARRVRKAVPPWRIDRAVPLSEYAWKFRYPGAPLDPELEETTEALEAARALVRDGIHPGHAKKIDKEAKDEARKAAAAKQADTLEVLVLDWLDHVRSHFIIPPGNRGGQSQQITGFGNTKNQRLAVCR